MGEKKRAPTLVASNFNDHLWPHFEKDFLIDPRVQWVLVGTDSHPPTLALFHKLFVKSDPIEESHAKPRSILFVKGN